MRITEAVTPFNLVTVLRLAGDVPPAAVRTALDTVQSRHPLLQACIRPVGRRFGFHFGVTAPIPLDVSHSPEEERWEPRVEEELHRPLPLADGPLARCRYLGFPSGCDLLLTLHHAIVDARSASHLVRELLDACDGVPLDPASDTMEGRVGAEALYPKDYQGVRFAGAAAAYAARQLADEARFRWRSRRIRKSPIADAGRCRVLAARTSAALTSRLVAAGRHHGVTLNSLLSAGLMATVHRRLYRSARAPLRHIVFADLRPHLRERPPDTALGAFVSMCRLTVTVERNADVWTLARDLQARTLDVLRAGDRFLSYSFSPAVMRMLLRLRAARMSATALSYTGPVTLTARYRGFTVTELHAFATNLTLGPEFSAIVRLFHGELWWDMLYLDSDMDAAGARAMASDIGHVLAQAAC